MRHQRGSPCQSFGAFCSRIEALEPSQRIFNFLGLKSDCVEFALQVGWLRAGVTCVVVFVNEDKNFKHVANIAQKITPLGRRLTFPAISRLESQPVGGGGSDFRDALEQSTRQAGDLTMDLKLHQTGLQGRCHQSGPSLQGI